MRRAQMVMAATVTASMTLASVTVAHAQTNEKVPAPAPTSDSAPASNSNQASDQDKASASDPTAAENSVGLQSGRVRPMAPTDQGKMSLPAACIEGYVYVKVGDVYGPTTWKCDENAMGGGKPGAGGGSSDRGAAPGGSQDLVAQVAPWLVPVVIITAVVGLSAALYREFYPVGTLSITGPKPPGL